MPAYITNPLDGIPPMLLPGVPGYSLGSFNADTPDAKLLVTSVAINGSNVATLGVQLIEGNIPAVGSLISVRGTQKAGGAFNVSNVALVSVTINAQTGAGTVTFALTHADVASTPDAGEAAVPVPEVAEAIASGTKGLQFGMQAVSGLASNSRDVSWVLATPSAPASFSATLEVADVDEESEYTVIDTATSVGLRTVLGVRANFIRVRFGTVTGGSSPTAVAKILT